MGKRGAPVGNQNARKHGFYSRLLTETEKLELKEAAGVEGLNDEIAILRVKLRSLFKEQPDRIDLHVKTINMISRLVKIRHSIAPEDKKALKNAVSDVLREIGIPLGLKFIPWQPVEKAERGPDEGRVPEVS